MLDINLIRENPTKVKEALAKKLWDTDFTELLQWDEERKQTLRFVEEIFMEEVEGIDYDFSKMLHFK